jgi:hypothetical protein
MDLLEASLCLKRAAAAFPNDMHTEPMRQARKIVNTIIAELRAEQLERETLCRLADEVAS